MAGVSRKPQHSCCVCRLGEPVKDPICWICDKPDGPTCECGNQSEVWHLSGGAEAWCVCHRCRYAVSVVTDTPINATTMAEARRNAVAKYRELLANLQTP
jgi:hypothetical protein